MDLNEVLIFIKVVQTGSFSQAAKQLGMPNSTVSSKISSLERRLGLTLIQRTTRRLNITAAGQAYFKRCNEGFAQIQAAEQELFAGKGEPNGLLRITAPVELGASVLPEVLTAYTRKYPKVSVDVILTDRRMDLMAENVDLAIRAGELKDSTLIAKKIGMACFALFASPKYLRDRGTPARPTELREHTCLQFTPLGGGEWRLAGPGGTRAYPVGGGLLINDLNMIRAMAVAGNGLALLPTFFCRSEERANRLVRVMEEWRTPPDPVHFVYPAQKFVQPKLSEFIAMAAGRVQDFVL